MAREKQHGPLWKRLAKGFAKGVVFLIAGLVGLIVLVLLIMNTSPVRTLITRQLNAALETTFTGKLVIDRVGSLSLLGLSGIDVSVFDARGKRVLVVKGARADSFLPRVGYEAVSGASKLRIDSISLDHVEVHLIDDGSGSPTLASAFSPRTPAKPPPPDDTSSMEIVLDKILLRHLWAHGQLATSPLIDVELADAEISLTNAAKGFNFNLKKANIKARALPERADPNGRLSVRLEIPSAKQAGLRTRGRFDGKVAGADLQLSFEVDGPAISARLEAPSIPASVISQRLPGVALQGPSAFRANVKGRLPELVLEANLDSPAGGLRVTATAHLEATTRILAQLELSRIDASQALPTAPKTQMNVKAQANLELSEAKPIQGTYQLSAESGRVGNETTPAVAIDGKVEKDIQGRLAATGSVSIEEPSAPTRLLYRFQNAPGIAGEVQVDLTSRLRDPPRLRRLGASGAGTLSAEIHFNLDARRLRASAEADLTAVAFSPHKAERVTLKAKAEGAPDALSVSGSVRAKNLTLADRHYATAKIDANGSLDRLALDAVLETISSERIEVEASLGLKPGISIDSPRISLVDREGRIDIDAERIRVDAGRVQVDKFQLKGAGNARGSASIGPSREELALTTEALDLPRLGRSVGVKLPLESGTLTLEANVVRQNEVLTGHVRGKASEITLAGVQKGSLDLDLEFDPKKLSGSVDAHFGPGGDLSLKIEELSIPRAPFTRERLANLPVAASIRGKLKLKELVTLVRTAGVPIETAAGSVDFQVRIENRVSDGRRPELSLRVETHGLRLIEQRSKNPTSVDSAKVAREVDPRTLEDIDLRALVELDRESGKASSEIEVVDPQGVLVFLNAETELPVNWIQQPDLAFKELPIRAKLRMPRRSLASLPRTVRPKTFQGIAELDLLVEGRLPKPRVMASFRVDRLHANLSRRVVDVQGEALYEEKGGNVLAFARSSKQMLATLRGDWQGDLVRAVDSIGAKQASPVTAEIQAKLDRFPLSLVPALRERQLGGTLSGNVSLKDLGRDAKLLVEIDGSRLSIGGARLKQLNASVKTERGALVGLVDVAGGTGKAHAEFRTPVQWGDRIVPTFSDTADARVTAQRFRIETLAPFLRASFSEVAGQLDADLTAKLDPKSTVLKGEARISDGVIHIPQIGQRFSELNAKAVIQSDEFRLERFEARGLTGKIRANARARLRGLSVQSAEAHVEIPERDKLPVTLEGASIGEASGRIDVTYAHQESAPMDEIRVDVPEFRLEVPEAAASDVQGLDPPEAIRVGVHRRDREFAPLPVQPLEPVTEEDAEEAKASRGLRVRIRLGSVIVERGQQVKVQLAGDLQQLIEKGESHLTGRIELKSGKLDVQGKTFEIERGIITFDGQNPPNPTITATARWDAPVGYAVFAEYAGTVKKGAIRLRSEPPLTQDEIASLILFGAPDGAVGSGGGGGNAAMAVGVAGDTAAKGLNQALSRFTDLDVSARIDTSTGSARPEIVVQVTPRLAAKITRAVGEPAPGQSPDRTFLTLELRLLRAWALLARVGDRGASTLDLIWRRRY